MNNIQSLNSLATPYKSAKSLGSLQNQTVTAPPENSGNKVTISDAAYIQNQLEVIKSKSSKERTSEDMDFLLKNDTKLAEIYAKDDQSLTAEEIDYVQKTIGFVNTMAYLNPKEKALYNELVASGNTEAASAMSQIALSRTGLEGIQVTLQNGRVFNPNTTEITASNVRNLFKNLIVDETGESDRSFNALATYLEQREVA